MRLDWAVGGTTSGPVPWRSPHAASTKNAARSAALNETWTQRLKSSQPVLQQLTSSGHTWSGFFSQLALRSTSESVSWSYLHNVACPFSVRQVLSDHSGDSPSSAEPFTEEDSDIKSHDTYGVTLSQNGECKSCFRMNIGLRFLFECNRVTFYVG